MTDAPAGDRARSRSRHIPRLAIAALATLLIASCDSGASSPAQRSPGAATLAVADPPAVDRAVVTIRGVAVDVDVARTKEAQRLGLGRYRSLDWGRGMIFPYEQQGFHGFWMKGMHFDIDIVWIRDSRIIDVAARVPAPPRPDAPDPARVHARELVDLVLEVPAGFAAAQGWRRGDLVAIEPSIR